MNMIYAEQIIIGINIQDPVIRKVRQNRGGRGSVNLKVYIFIFIYLYFYIIYTYNAL